MLEMQLSFIFTGYMEDTDGKVHETFFSYFYALVLFTLSFITSTDGIW